MTDLHGLGWTDDLAEDFAARGSGGAIPARVASQHRRTYTLFSERGELEGTLAGRFRHAARTEGGLPAAGDWVEASPAPGEPRATIVRLLRRSSVFSRKTAGKRTAEQVIAANIDTLFLVSGLDRDFNLSRIQRYLLLARDGGADPVLVLNKADAVGDPAPFVEQAASVAEGAPVLAMSALRKDGLSGLLAHLGRGRTGALVGSSGVGKSTIINQLVGRPLLEVRGLRRGDGKGRHTTTRRELILLGEEGLLIDTPGLREIQLWADEGAIDGAFRDVELLAEGCRFRDCRHRAEPGCAVIAALDEGALAPERYEAYGKLMRELEHLRAKRDDLAHLAGKKRWKDIAKVRKEIKRRKG
jgi:ribosome biogenesis GTPase